MKTARPSIARAGLTGHTGSNRGDVSETVRDTPGPGLAGADDAVLHGLDILDSTTQREIQPLTRLFRALGEQTRLRIVAWLSHGELSVCHLEKALMLSQPNVSRQLGILRTAGIVSSHRRGTWVYYSLAAQDHPEVEAILGALVKSFGKEQAIGAEHARLRRTHGPEADG